MVEISPCAVGVLAVCTCSRSSAWHELRRCHDWGFAAAEQGKQVQLCDCLFLTGTMWRHYTTGALNCCLRSSCAVLTCYLSSAAAAAAAEAVSAHLVGVSIQQRVARAFITQDGSAKRAVASLHCGLCGLICTAAKLVKDAAQQRKCLTVCTAALSAGLYKSAAHYACAWCGEAAAATARTRCCDSDRRHAQKQQECCGRLHRGECHGC
jgi:hypothetical protein